MDRNSVVDETVHVRNKNDIAMKPWYFDTSSTVMCVIFFVFLVVLSGVVCWHHHGNQQGTMRALNYGNNDEDIDDKEQRKKSEERRKKVKKMIGNCKMTVMEDDIIKENNTTDEIDEVDESPSTDTTGTSTTKSLRSLFILPSNGRKLPNSCSVCLEEYEPGDTVVWSSNKSCPHAFHEECILRWFVKTRGLNCPYCRQRFFDTNRIADRRLSHSNSLPAAVAVEGEGEGDEEQGRINCDDEGEAKERRRIIFSSTADTNGSCVSKSCERRMNV